MASYATYRHVELDRVGVGKKRVLKPPGGGSSIVFDEEENKPIKSKPQPQQQPPKEDTPQAETVEKQAPPPPQESGDAKPETNGMNSHDSVKEDAAASRDSFPSFPSPAPATNGQHSPAPNGSPAVNGSSAINGSVSSGSTSSMSPFPGGTPKHLNTQTRIFGEDHNVLTPRRRLRDHERSNIFADEGAANGTHRPADSSSSNSSSSCPSSGTPEARTPEQAPQPQPPQQQQQQQRQRVPPGGFSTRLW